MENKYQPIDREPDVETPGFKVWVERREEGLKNLSPLITINADIGEEVYESRLYQSTVLPGYELLILSKKNGDSYWFAVKGKRPDGQTFMKTAETGPMSLEKYQDRISRMEADFSIAFDTQNPQITPGRHYMLYMKKAQK